MIVGKSHNEADKQTLSFQILMLYFHIFQTVKTTNSEKCYNATEMTLTETDQLNSTATV